MTRVLCLFALIFTVIAKAEKKSKQIQSIKVEAMLSASKKCSQEGPMVAFVYYEDKPNEYLYQVEVPVGGNTEFIVLPGQYQIEAVNKIGCFGRVQFDLRKPASEKISLSLEIKE